MAGVDHFIHYYRYYRYYPDATAGVERLVRKLRAAGLLAYSERWATLLGPPCISKLVLMEGDYRAVAICRGGEMGHRQQCENAAVQSLQIRTAAAMKRRLAWLNLTMQAASLQ